MPWQPGWGSRPASSGPGWILVASDSQYHLYHSHRQGACPAGRGTTPVYVCLCNALTDVDIRRAAALLGAKRPADVFGACNCTVQCGRCSRTMTDMIREERAKPQPLPLAAE